MDLSAFVLVIRSGWRLVIFVDSWYWGLIGVTILFQLNGAAFYLPRWVIPGCCFGLWLRRDRMLRVNIVIGGWRSSRLGWPTWIRVCLAVLIVAEVKYFVNFFYFASFFLRFDDQTIRFAINIHLFIAYMFIFPSFSSPILNHFDCSFVNSFASSFIVLISWILSWWSWLIYFCLLLLSWIMPQ